MYTGDWSKLGGLEGKQVDFEVFICHNGDFDAFEVIIKTETYT